MPARSARLVVTAALMAGVAGACAAGDDLAATASAPPTTTPAAAPTAVTTGAAPAPSDAPTAANTDAAPAPSAPSDPASSTLATTAPTRSGAGGSGPPPSGVPPTPFVTIPPAPTRPITIAFGGDVHGEPPIAGVLAAGANPFEFVAEPLAAADIAMVNLETAVGSSGSPADKEFVFQASPALLDAMVAAGIDVVSVANNHSFDMGAGAFLETIDNARSAGLVPVGGGRTEAEAYAPAVIDVGGTPVALIGLAKIGPEEDQRAVGDRPGTTNGRDRARTVAAVQAARALTPVVIVFVHWGNELAECPRDDDIALAQAVLDAGASAVIGMHPHVLQGISTRADAKLVAWSIGNFAFYAKRAEARATGVFTLTVAPDGTVTDLAIAPARIDDSGRPRLLEGSDAQATLDDIAALEPVGGTCPPAV